SPATRERLDTLLRPDKADGNESAQDNNSGSASAVLLKLRGSPGRPSLASMQDEMAKLELIRQIELPGDLFDRASPRDLERCRRRVSVEVPRDLRRHPDAARITWLAAFVYLRARSLTDDLVDLLIETIHQIGARAERKVERELLNDLKRVNRKAASAVRAGRCHASPAGRHSARCGLSGGRRTNVARLGQGVEGHRADLPHHSVHSDPQLLPGTLSPHGAQTLVRLGVPLQQRPPSPGDASVGTGQALCR